MAVDSRDPNSYTVKELLSQFVIPALDDLRNAAEAKDRHYMELFDKSNTRIAKLEDWRNKGIGAVAIITGILVPVAIPVIITLLTAGITGALAFYWGIW